MRLKLTHMMPSAKFFGKLYSWQVIHAVKDLLCVYSCMICCSTFSPHVASMHIFWGRFYIRSVVTHKSPPDDCVDK